MTRGDTLHFQSLISAVFYANHQHGCHIHISEKFV